MLICLFYVINENEVIFNFHPYTTKSPSENTEQLLRDLVICIYFIVAVKFNFKMN
jgi:hypothetical protein